MECSPVRAESDATFTIRPLVSSRSGSAARMTFTVPIRVTSTTRRVSSAVVSWNFLIVQVAALLTSTDTGPSCSRTDASACSTPASSVMFASTPIAVPPLPLICSATVLAASADMSRMATLAPASASRVAMPAPMPLPPPVTTATSELRSICTLIVCLPGLVGLDVLGELGRALLGERDRALLGLVGLGVGVQPGHGQRGQPTLVVGVGVERRLQIAQRGGAVGSD